MPKQRCWGGGGVGLRPGSVLELHSSRMSERRLSGTPCEVRSFSFSFTTDTSQGHHQGSEAVTSVSSHSTQAPQASALFLESSPPDESSRTHDGGGVTRPTLHVIGLTNQSNQRGQPTLANQRLLTWSVNSGTELDMDPAG